jgi:hypothetical protein
MRIWRIIVYIINTKLTALDFNSDIKPSEGWQIDTAAFLWTMFMENFM